MAEDVLTALRSADNKKILKLLKQYKEDVNTKHGENQTTFLHAACKQGNDKIVKYLLEKGAEIHCTTNTGWTPLHKAVAWSHPKCVRLLISAGANVNACTHAANTSLHLASKNTKYIYHKQVLKKKDYEDDESNKNSYETIQVLITSGADVNAKNYLGQTPLHNAAVQGHLYTVSLLLDNEADVNIRDNRRRTAVDVARLHKQYEVLDWFMEQELQEERLARQDLARFASSEHDRLEKRLLELAEEHEAELAEQRAQLLQAYKVDSETQKESFDEDMKKELVKKEAVILQLNSLVKAERQNMDNDYLGYHKQITELQAVLHDINIEKHGHLKFIEELEFQVQERNSVCSEQEATLAILTSQLQELQQDKDVGNEAHKAEIEKLSLTHQDKLLLLQQTIDQLQVDLTSYSALSEERQAANDSLKQSLIQQQQQQKLIDDQLDEVKKALSLKEGEIDSLSTSLTTQNDEVETIRTERDTMKNDLGAARDKQQEVQLHFQQVLKTQETDLAKLKEENAKCIVLIDKYKNQENELKQNQLSLTNLQSETTVLKEQHQKSIDTVKSENASLMKRYQQQIEQYEIDKENIEKQHEEVMHKQKSNVDLLSKKNQETLEKLHSENEGLQQKHQEMMSKMESEKGVLQQQYQQSLNKMKEENSASDEQYKMSLQSVQSENHSLKQQHQEVIARLQSENSSLKQQHQESITRLQSENSNVKQQQQETITRLQSENTKKIADVQQKITEKDKQLIVINNQLKHNSETIKNFENNQQKLKQQHQTELKKLESRLTEEHQGVIDKFKTDLNKQHQTELIQIQNGLKDQHKMELEQREVKLKDRHKEEIVRLQKDFANKQSGLQQEMFKIAGAEQTKLKEQHEKQLVQKSSQHQAEIQSVQQKFQQEHNTVINQEQQLQNLKQQLSADAEGHQKQLSSLSGKYDGQINKLKKNLDMKESELAKNGNQVSELQQLNRDVESRHSKEMADVQEKYKADRTGEVNTIEQKYTSQVQQLQETIKGKDESLTAKQSELKQQDDIIKSYVKENTNLKDEYSCQIADLQATVQELQRFQTEASEWEEKYCRLEREISSLQSQTEDVLNKKLLKERHEDNINENGVILIDIQDHNDNKTIDSEEV